MRHFSNDLATRALLVVGIASVFVAAECIAAEAAAGREVPPGAAALGYTKCVIDERPSVADISFDNTGNAKWFNGLWCTPPAPRGKFEMVDGVLAIHPDGVLTSAPRDFSPRWRLPPLPGKDGFYVEFDVRLSDNDHDHWPAVWLMPIGTDQKNGSHYESDPPGAPATWNSTSMRAACAPAWREPFIAGSGATGESSAIDTIPTISCLRRWIGPKCIPSAPATTRRRRP